MSALDPSTADLPEGFDAEAAAARAAQVGQWGLGPRTHVNVGLPTRLHADGTAGHDVPAKLAARARLLSTGHGGKSHNADAVSVGVAR